MPARTTASLHRAAACTLLLAALACSAPGLTTPQGGDGGEPAAPAAATPAEEPTTAPSPAPPEDTPFPALSTRPLIWFAPLPPMEIREGRPFIGSDDFMQLFFPDAPWAQAAGRVGVFKLYGEWVSEDATDAELRQVIDDLNRRGIAIAFEAGPLPLNAGCGQGIEGFAGIGEGRRIANRIKDAGGTVQFIAFDEPFAFGHIYDGPNACQWSPERIATEVAQYVDAMRTVFPGVVVGDIEPLWAGADVDSFKTWIEAYEAMTGSPLAFFHLDLDWTRQTWPEDALELETFARAHGVEFGMIYFGDWEDPSDEVWLGRVEERMVTYESLAGGRPDHVIIQSWHDHPDRVLPETDPHTFTNMINRYLRARTTLELAAGRAGGAGDASLSGSLLDQDGAPLAGQPIDYVVTPLSGDGVYGEYTVTGIVPDGADHANVGFRVNTECGCSGASDFALHSVRYFEYDSDVNRVPNPAFASGLGGWGLWGEGSVLLEASDRGTGQMLHVTAAPGQVAAINSDSFPVTAGAAFQVTFAARVAPHSVGSGYFALFFLSPTTEVARSQIPLEAAATVAGTATTGSGGEFSLPLASLPPEPLQVEASFAGDERYWPAISQATIPAP